MTKYKYSFYHILYEKKENEFEKIFNEIWNQLNIYERQFELTLKSYKKEWSEESSLRNSRFKEQELQAKEIYDNVFNDNSDDEFAHQYAMNASGLDYIQEEHYNDLQKIDSEYENFLNLYSKSILIALYSMNESKLNNITEIASDIFNKKIKPSHFSGRDYLNSSLQYLNLVIEIEIETIEKYISKLKDLQYLRNNIVHSDSKFSDIEVAKKIVDKQKDVLSIDDKGQLKIKESKFIKDIFKLLSEFYEELFWLFDLKQDSIIIKNGMMHWLGQIDRGITLEDFSVKVLSNEKIIYFKAITTKAEVQSFECKINLAKSRSKSFALTNQTENEHLTGFLEYENELNGMYLREVFNSFFSNQDNNIKIMAY